MQGTSSAQAVSRTPRSMVSPGVPADLSGAAGIVPYDRASTQGLLDPRRGLSFPYDLAELAEGARSVLDAQSYSKALLSTARRIEFYDVDFTLLHSLPTPVWLKHMETGEQMLHPATGDLVEFGMNPGVDVSVEYEQIKSDYPGLDWDAYAPDGSASSKAQPILDSPPMEAGLSLFREAHSDPLTAMMIITARGDHDSLIDALKQWLDDRDLSADAVMLTYHPMQQQALQMEKANHQSIKKLLAIVAMVSLHQREGAPLEAVRFVEDNVQNLSTAKQILPELFPDIDFEFVQIKKDGRCSTSSEFAA